MTTIAPRTSYVVVSRERAATTQREADRSVPSSFEEMFATHYDYVVRLVAQSGIDFQNAEDVAMTILTKFFEKDALNDFDPEFTTEYGGITRKAVFRTFLSGFVKTYVRHYRDRQEVTRLREGFSVDTVMFTYADSGEPATWMDLQGPSFEEKYEDLAEQDLLASIRSRLQHSTPRNSQDQCNMPEFFEAVLRQTYAEGRVDTAALAEEFGVSKTSIQNWLKRLRSEVSSVIEE